MNSLLMAKNGCLISLPSSLFAAAKSHSHQHFSLACRPAKLDLSCSYSSSSLPFLLSLRRKKTTPRFPSLVSVIAAQQEEDNTIVLDEQDQEEGNISEAFNWVNEESVEEGDEEEEEGVVEAVGDAGESDDTFGGYEGEYPEPPEDAKLFVGNLPYDVDHEGLARIFQQAGTVEIAEVIYNRDTEHSRGFGFVTMNTVEEAEKAVEMFHRYDCNGRLLTVNKAAPRGTRPERPPRSYEPSCRIYVGNIPWSVDDSRLEQVFSEHGKVVSARVVCDRETGRSRGFGFVTMSSEAEMNDAIADLDGKNLDGRAIRVNAAEDRPRRNF